MWPRNIAACSPPRAVNTYLQELKLDSPLYIDYLILDYAPKLFHVLMQMYHAEDGFMAAYTEQILMHVDLKQRRVIPFSNDKLAMIESYCSGHAGYQRPKGLGEAVGDQEKTVARIWPPDATSGLTAIQRLNFQPQVLRVVGNIINYSGPDSLTQ